MQRPLILVCLALAVSAPVAAAAQDSSSTVVQARARQDSASAGRAAGKAAGQHRGVGGYFAMGLVSGIALGVGAPGTFGNRTPDVQPVMITTAGAAGLIGASLHGARAGVTLRRADETQLQQHGAQYQQAFRLAYTSQVQHRRTRAALFGGAAGAVVGYGALWWFFTQVVR